ncbi:MAG: hypothetical protein HAW67_01850 [Endozoicomonadaceae bacterium]|nr:hypothetical protein [Endozoicomonadaceae bacterium]
MDFSEIRPGDILVSNFNFVLLPYQHWSLVSDRKCSNGYYMLISASERTGTVKEEPIKDVVQGATTYQADLIPQVHISSLLANAREQINVWSYSIADRNCQHFVNWVCGFGLTSGQVKTAAALSLIGGVTTALVSEKPTWFKILGVAVACGAIGVIASKVKPQKEKA